MVAEWMIPRLLSGELLPLLGLRRSLYACDFPLRNLSGKLLLGGNDYGCIVALADGAASNRHSKSAAVLVFDDVVDVV